jgi:hypothetical protein
VLKTKTIETYLTSLNKNPSIDEFIYEVRKMSFKNWDERFTTQKINAYIKSSY